MSNGCAVCHGDHGRGDGRIASTLKPPPRDFRDLTHYKKGHEVEQIAETIGKGIAGTSMPGFSHLTVKDRRSMARYIAYLQQQP
jgi:high-affinity iron transporter